MDSDVCGGFNVAHLITNITILYFKKEDMIHIKLSF